MEYKCKNLPLEHHGDVGCPHCTIAMHINDWLLSMDAAEYIKDVREKAPRLTRRLTDAEVAVMALVGGMSILLSRMIYETGNPLLTGICEVQMENAFSGEAARRENEARG